MSPTTMSWDQAQMRGIAGDVENDGEGREGGEGGGGKLAVTLVAFSADPCSLFHLSLLCHAMSRSIALICQFRLSRLNRQM